MDYTECDVSTTVGDYEPSFIKRQRDEKYRLDFAVKGATDAVVWLSEQENKDKHYEIGESYITRMFLIFLIEINNRSVNGLVRNKLLIHNVLHLV